MFTNINKFLSVLEAGGENWSNIIHHRIDEKKAKLCLKAGLIRVVGKNGENEDLYGLTDLGEEMLKNGKADKYIENFEE